MNHVSRQLSASDSRLAVRAPTTNPACTALVSQAACVVLSPQSRVRPGMTAVAENHVVSDNTTAQPATANALQRLCGRRTQPASGRVDAPAVAIISDGMILPLLRNFFALDQPHLPAGNPALPTSTEFDRPAARTRAL